MPGWAGVSWWIKQKIQLKQAKSDRHLFWQENQDIKGICPGQQDQIQHRQRQKINDIKISENIEDTNWKKNKKEILKSERMRFKDPYFTLKSSRKHCLVDSLCSLYTSEKENW